EERGRVTHGTPGFAVEQLLAAQLGGGRPGRDQPAEPIESGGGRPGDDRVEITHPVGAGAVELAPADLQLKRDVAVEILLDLGEMIDRADRAPRAEEQVVVVAAQGRGNETPSSVMSGLPAFSCRTASTKSLAARTSRGCRSTWP